MGTTSVAEVLRLLQKLPDHLPLANFLASIEDKAVLKSIGRDILWRDPGGDATTAAELQAIIDLSLGRPSVIVQNVASVPNVIPAGAWDFRHAMLWSDYMGDGSEIDVNSAALKNVNWLLGSRLRFHGTSTFDLDVTGGNPRVLIAAYGGGMSSDCPAPPITVPDNEVFIYGAVLGGSLDGSGGQPIVSLGAGSLFYAIAAVQTTPPAFGNDTVIGPASSFIIYGHDGSFTGFPTQTGFLGTAVNYPLNGNGGSGPTSARPVNPFGPLVTGWTYYDTTIDKPIVVNNALVWVDYAGVPV